MTRDEYRTACIDIMEEAFYTNGMVNNTIREGLIAAFDALHGVVLVNPIKPTKEMSMAVPQDLRWEPRNSTIFTAMSAAGDLTNRPKKKL